MNKQEAIEALKQGKKLTHRYFTPDEWITLDGDMMVMEDGATIDASIFWKDRENWSDDGWSEYFEREFIRNEWEFETSSGYGGYRNKRTHEWIHVNIFEEMLSQSKLNSKNKQDE